ncbi:unnamed protein product [Caenorhabditis angaria]|uniref:Uncharacterized protein n=1 Tax=Caenorhabditis angaria TaxID=860376 RepID=A0A9P1IU45_9PELO|nr:unnamed protein product [Caenorhabditis angaria]
MMSRKNETRRDRRIRAMGTISSDSVAIDVPYNPPAQSNHTTTVSQPNPPSYYAEVMSTDASALYPVYVPPYAAPLMSLRDPRQFQGLPGLAAPPPYPPPPSYSQISNFPELPSASHTIVDAAQQPRITKKVEDVTPVE